MNRLSSTFSIIANYSKEIKIGNTKVLEKPIKKELIVTFEKENNTKAVLKKAIFKNLVIAFCFAAVSSVYATSIFVPVIYSVEILSTIIFASLFLLSTICGQNFVNFKNRFTAYKQVLNYIENNYFKLSKNTSAIMSASKSRINMYDQILANVVIHVIILFAVIIPFGFLSCKGIAIYFILETAYVIFSNKIEILFSKFITGNPQSAEYEEATDIADITLKLQQVYEANNENEFEVRKVISEKSFWEDYVAKYGIAVVKSKKGAIIADFTV